MRQNIIMNARTLIRWLATASILWAVLFSPAGIEIDAQDAISGSSVRVKKDPYVNSRGEKKLVVGTKEKVYFPGPAVFMVARIDSGAAYSSLHATQIRRFERDGREWVGFNLDFDDKYRYMERPLEDLVLIRQAGSANVSERPVVELDVRLGRYSVRLSFSLTDRGHMTYPVILGRDFLYDRALVDVSSEFLMSSN